MSRLRCFVSKPLDLFPYLSTLQEVDCALEYYSSFTSRNCRLEIGNVVKTHHFMFGYTVTPVFLDEFFTVIIIVEYAVMTSSTD